MNFTKKIILGLVLVGFLLGASILLKNNPTIYPVDPTKAVAIVNGIEIPKDELDVYFKQIILSQGKDENSLTEESKKQIHSSIVNMLVSQELLYQAAQAEGVTVDQRQVNANFTSIEKQFENKELFIKQLQSQNYTEESFREQIKKDLQVEKYLDVKLGLSKLTVNDDELQLGFEELSKIQDIKTIEGNEDQIKNFVIGQKTQTLIMGLIEEIKSQAEIKILI
jgi:hypothetical protein